MGVEQNGLGVRIVVSVFYEIEAAAGFTQRNAGRAQVGPGTVVAGCQAVRRGFVAMELNHRICSERAGRAGQPGVLIHIHDIFLPDPYPPSWVVNEHMFWNEQILLAAFLSFNTSFQVELAAHYLESRHFDALIAAVPNVRPKDSGSIWLKRIA